MALAKKCDRCNGLYDYYDKIERDKDGYRHGEILNMNAIQSIKLTLRDEYVVRYNMDLCPTCMKQFINWFELPHVNNIHLDDYMTSDYEKIWDGQG